MLYLSCWSKTQSCWKQRMIWQFASPLYIWLWSATRTKYSSTWKQPQYSITSKYGWSNTFASSLQLFIWFSSHNIPAFIESVSRRSKNKVLWWKYCISSFMYLWLFSKIYFIFTRTLPASCTWNKWRWPSSSVCCNIFFSNDSLIIIEWMTHVKNHFIMMKEWKFAAKWMFSYCIYNEWQLHDAYPLATQ